MAYTTINKSTDYFNTVLYTGNGSTNAITGVGHQPDLVWLKKRSSTGNHYLIDSVRGVTKTVYSNLTNAEATESNSLTAFGTDGFTLGSDSDVNANSTTLASWNWKANGAGSANTDGSINTTATSVNTTAGFSISKYTGTGSNATVGHGLGVAPKMILFRNLTNSSTAWNWGVYHKDIGAGNVLHLNNTEALSSSATAFNSTDPTTNVFSVGSWGGTNYSGDNIIAYCFAEKPGYSKFGSYTGNGNADGSFIYTGFKPAFVITKRTDGTGNWLMYDNKRIGYNPSNYFLFPHLTNAEDTSNSEWLDLYSNGFKTRVTSTTVNGSGNSYIFMAFGQSLVGSNNVPCTAR